MTTLFEHVTESLSKNDTTLPISTNTTSASGSSDNTSFYFALVFIIIPGVVTNSFAVYFIARDIKKAAFPAIILLLALCTSDLVAVIFSLVRHTITRFYNDTSYTTCASLSVLHSFSKLYSGVLNAMMAVDRVLAICKPFYYKSKIDVSTYRKACIVSAFGVAFVSVFPVIGLGDVMTTRNSRTYCSTYSYRSEPLQKVYGFVYIVISYIIITLIVSLNTILIVTILKLNRRVVSLNTTKASTSTDSSGAPSANRTTPFEIAFAKLMGCLALVYLVCGTPYNTLIMLQQVKIKVDGASIGVIHFMAGLSYTADPIVYILIRKMKLKCMVNIFCRCCKRKTDMA